MLILHNLVKFTLLTEELIQIYILYIRSVLENCAAVWHSSLTGGQELELERVQKTALKIILKENYVNYEEALFERREHLCRKRAVRFCRLRGNCLLFGCALTFTCRADSARPLIGYLDMNIVCQRQCSDQSEARIPVT